jgi:deoxyribodipyrimidine photolyase-related protein
MGMAEPVISVWILGDQLLANHPALQQAVQLAGRDRVRLLLIESARRTAQRPYQRQKLVLLFSAMRHYAAELEAQGYQVDYHQADSFTAGLQKHLQQWRPAQLLTMAASSYPGRQFQAGLATRLNVPVDILPNSQFLTGRYNPIPNPAPDKQYVMEYFYRDMRRHFDVLMEGKGPVGGRWNYDQENRQPLPPDNQPPSDRQFAPDAITQAVMAELADWQPGVGTTADFGYAVTRAQALALFDDFLTHRLAEFGPYEDAMSGRSHSLYHSLLSPYLNLGLLEPMELIRAAEQAYRDGRAPLNSVEGFTRQILGWREFIYWQYWRQMPGMTAQNSWQAERPLPQFFWTGETEMACLRHALQRALATGYNHHIERLMLLANFLMLSGVDPAEANGWFLSLYIDAYDWVMAPNVIGMGLNADGGLTATKPYIAAANYINKMSDHCAGCRYNPRQRHGEDACPFNFLYWHFLLVHEARLRANPRLGRNVLGLRYLDEAERAAVRRQAETFLDSF